MEDEDSSSKWLSPPFREIKPPQQQKHHHHHHHHHQEEDVLREEDSKAEWPHQQHHHHHHQGIRMEDRAIQPTRPPGPALLPMLPCGLAEEPSRLFHGNAAFRLLQPPHLGDRVGSMVMAFEQEQWEHDDHPRQLVDKPRQPDEVGRELPTNSSTRNTYSWDDGPSDDTQRGCECCAEVPDTSHWILVEPEVSTENCISTYSLSSAAGSYECSESSLRWLCACPVNLQYRFMDWYVFTEELAHMQCSPAGPLMDIQLRSGALEEIHLPHFLCLGGVEAADNAVMLLHGRDGGVCLEKCEVTRHHVRFLQPSLSPLGSVYSSIPSPQSVPQPLVPQPLVPQPLVSPPSMSHPSISHHLVSHALMSHHPVSQLSTSYPSVSHPSVHPPFMSHPFLSHPLVSHPISYPISHPFMSHLSVSHPSMAQPSLSVPPVSHPSMPQLSLSHPSMPHPSVPHPSVSHPSVSQLSLSSFSLPYPSMPHPSVSHPSICPPSLSQPSLSARSIPPHPVSLPVVSDHWSPKAHCELLLFHERITASLKLRTYLVPNDQGLIIAIHQQEKDWKGERIKKNSRVRPPLRLKDTFRVTTSCPSKIEPKEIELVSDSIGNFCAVSIKHPVESFDVEVKRPQHEDPIWTISVEKEDYSPPSTSPGLHSTSSSTRTQTLDLFSTFDELRCKELKRFKAYLSEKIMEGFEPIPRGQLEQCDETDLASKMIERYGKERAVRMTLTLLRKMELNDLANRLEVSITSTGQ